MAGSNGATALAVTRQNVPELGRLIDQRSLSMWRRSFGAVLPSTLHGIIRQVEQGELQDWADFAAWMLYTDATVRASALTRIAAVAGADFEVLPGRARQGEEQLAMEAADAFRENLEDTTDLERLFADLLYGALIGWSGAENIWTADGGRWVNRPQWLDPREFRAWGNGEWGVRDNRTQGGNGWVRIAEHPGKFILHVPRNISTVATLSGDLLSVAWPWLFKRWGEKNWLAALEKWASPFVYGRVTANTPANVRAAMLTGIQSIAMGATATFEVGPELGGEPIAALDVSDSVKDNYGPAITYWNGEITKGLLGSTDNVQADHGSNARAESQGQQTILPRNMSDAKRLCGTVERDWAAPFARYNAGYFGRVPPTPRLNIVLIREEESAKEIYAYHMRGFLVTPNEIRAQLRQDPWTPEQLALAGLPPTYGDTPLNLVDAPGGAPAEAPFSAAARPQRLSAASQPRQLRLPLTSRATTSPTSSGSAPNPIALALGSRSGGRES